ncbi:S41 family peptidase [Brumimicrobium mesophilum]|uniref:S41 family peptidase n=1 Tax=Brumimicrobium mesophilum TaxID=392717 RepID=UPI000D1448FA|nr:S41 family peptidase [Brumimicrobium mesophilum]
MRNIYAIVFLFLFGISNTSFSQSNGFEVIKNLELIDLIYMNLDKYYVDEPKTGEISKAAIDAMLVELDPYTVYYHESNIEDYRLMTTGQYGGIGALIRKSGEYVFIAEPYENMPAQKAGLKAGDKILSIDGRSMKSVDSDVVSDALKGAKGSSFMLEYERPNGGVNTIKVERDEIKVPDVPYFGMVDEKGKIGYIKLTSFTQTASKSIKSAYDELSKEGMEKIILDLRGNGGGLLIESIDIVNFFVDKDEVIVKTKGRIEDENRIYKTRNSPIDLEIPVVVLVDGYSASASEIVSGSLQDLDRGVIIGSTTFGKGLVQRTIDLKYGAKMKLTIAKYYTPSGRCVQKLDYYHKNNGEVDEVPDSLIKIFHTKNGREVIDGRGIEPDIRVEEENLARLTAVLMGENIVFDFATNFSQANPEIASAKEFQITDKVYKDFKDYVLKQDFEYKTATQEYLERVLETAKSEGYDQKINGEFKALQKVVSASKEDDLVLFENQIKELLSNEIVSRYYYQEGRVVNAFQDDEPLKKAIEVLNDNAKYKSLLKP